MWIPTILPLLILSAAPAKTGDCITLSDYQRTLAVVELRGVDLYKSSAPEKVGRVLALDLSRNPPSARFEGGPPSNWRAVCVLRDEVELEVAYQLSVIVHDWDGVACVTFDEGRPHSRLFQRVEHNQGREVRLYPFARTSGGWRRIDARAGFTRESFQFDCGVTVGDVEVLEALKNGLLDGADTVVRAASHFAKNPAFEKKSEFTWNQKVYWTGTGLAVPNPTEP